jgi:succinate-semialdehyde dehydrogenase/glutarate-semialdehyde dehydrogenase
MPNGKTQMGDRMDEALNLIAGAWVTGAPSDVPDKYTGAPASVVHTASREQVSVAIEAAVKAQAACVWTPFERYEVLSRAAHFVEADAEALVATVMRDTGFVRADAVSEVTRTVQTLRLSAEAARQVGVGEMVPMSGAPGGAGRLGFTLRFPVGVVGAITPFNSPLNTLAHKVAPALAAGNAVVVKPAHVTPLSAVALARHLVDAGVPEGLVSIVNGPGSTTGQALLEDPRVDFYTLTGSSEVGRLVARYAGLRRTQLELGSIAAAVVCPDADLDRAIPKVVASALVRKAGQVCTSVQRLYVAAGLYDDVVAALVAAAAAVRCGDPAEAGTGVGPLITRAAADRVATWVRRASDAGATVLTGGTRDGSVITPVVLTDVDDSMDVMCSEVFGPVVSVLPYDDLADAVAHANDTPYGLSAGVFTQDLSRALWAARHLRFGAVHINESSSARLDLMPFGGVKDSGHGHEGPLYAAREMTEERLVTVTMD